jgi:hypothetical protein
MASNAWTCRETPSVEPTSSGTATSKLRIMAVRAVVSTQTFVWSPATQPLYPEVAEDRFELSEVECFPARLVDHDVPRLRPDLVHDLRGHAAGGQLSRTGAGCRGEEPTRTRRGVRAIGTLH